MVILGNEHSNEHVQMSCLALFWTVAEMVLEGVNPFDLKTNTLIPEQVQGNKLQYLDCLCDFFVPQVFSNIVILEECNWSNIFQGKSSDNSP